MNYKHDYFDRIVKPVLFTAIFLGIAPYILAPDTLCIETIENDPEAILVQIPYSCNEIYVKPINVPDEQVKYYEIIQYKLSDYSATTSATIDI